MGYQNELKNRITNYKKTNMLITMRLSILGMYRTDELPYLRVIHFGKVSKLVLMPRKKAVHYMKGLDSSHPKKGWFL